MSDVKVTPLKLGGQNPLPNENSAYDPGTTRAIRFFKETLGRLIFRVKYENLSQKHRPLKHEKTSRWYIIIKGSLKDPRQYAI